MASCFAQKQVDWEGYDLCIVLIKDWLNIKKTLISRTNSSRNILLMRAQLHTCTCIYVN